MTRRIILVSTTGGQVLSVPFINELGSIHRTLSHSDENRRPVLPCSLLVQDYGREGSRVWAFLVKATAAESELIYGSNLTLEIEVMLPFPPKPTLTSWPIYSTTGGCLSISSSSYARAYNLIGGFLRAVRSCKHAVRG
ncbi:hypothetical protein EV421DRAFT_970415 [Armillaria borealis]|uniref:Uncharacterized protein n=1 Tax=Armillaria borealis TaxID=47425 RepID=A0AA39IBY5_9AGAR|nr:hypothetical protein EV421DRAFT_970415 [Armillaria borealis]